MDDAYTIGIRLALDDGVSAGITAISGDLAMLDRAIAATIGSLSRLTAIGGDATHAAAAELQRFARQSEQLVRVPQPPAADTSPAPAQPPRATDVFPPAKAFMTTTGAAPTTATPQRAPATPPPLPAVAAPPTAPPKLTAPVVRILAPAPPTASSPIPVSTSPAPPALTVFAPPRPHDRSAPPATAPSVEVQQHFVTNQAPAAALPPTSAPPAASAPAAPIAGVPIAPSVLMEPRMPSVAPPPSPQAATGPSHGDVYLDGMRVGRWMSDNLAREAARPQAGGTAFDPRITPAWPGTLQGN